MTCLFLVYWFDVLFRDWAIFGWGLLSFTLPPG
jgi:hypothetical protein